MAQEWFLVTNLSGGRAPINLTVVTAGEGSAFGEGAFGEGAYGGGSGTGTTTNFEISYTFNDLTTTSFSNTPSMVGSPLQTIGSEAGSGVVENVNGEPVFAVKVAATTSAEAVSRGKYLEVVVNHTNPDQIWTPELITMEVARGGTATPRGFDVRYSADNFGTTLGGGAVPTIVPNYTPYVIPLVGAGDVTGELRLRIYTYTPQATHFIEFDNIKVTGRFQTTTRKDQFNDVWADTF